VAARSGDNYAAANNCAAIFTDSASIELVAVIAAMISRCAALLVKTTRHVGFAEIEERLELRARAAARVSNSYSVPRDSARRMANDRDSAQRTLVPCRDSIRPTRIEEAQR
jgi:hypothetical protein